VTAEAGGSAADGEQAAGPPPAAADAMRFALADPARRLSAVRLVPDVPVPGPVDLQPTAGGWSLVTRRPADLDRLEYLLEIEDRRGRRHTVVDPANPRRARGAFGDKSVLELPGYQAPEWLDWPRAGGTETAFSLPAPGLGEPVSGSLWSSAGLAPDVPAPLLLVHDGPEYADLGDLRGFLSAGTATGTLPPLRAALVAPGERDAWYSADPDYARALAEVVVPALDRVAPSTARIGVGVSLGALALLHAHRSHPDVFDALLLQSGSFFTPELDPHERRFRGFPTVTAFVAGVHAATGDDRPVPVTVTCGLPEENLANNRAMAATLERLGCPLRLVEVRDGHNYTAWRDALHPHLTDLVSSVGAERAA